MVNFGPLTADIGSGVWGTPTNFNGFCAFTVTFIETFHIMSIPLRSEELEEVTFLPQLVCLYLDY